MGRRPRVAKQANLAGAASSAYGRRPGTTLTAPASFGLCHAANFRGRDSRYLLHMSVDHTNLQANLPDLAQNVATATSPLARFVPTAATVPDQTIDQWVE